MYIQCKRVKPHINGLFGGSINPRIGYIKTMASDISKDKEKNDHHVYFTLNSQNDKFKLELFN